MLRLVVMCYDEVGVDGDGDGDGVGGGVFLEYFHLLAVAWTDHGHAHHVH